MKFSVGQHVKVRGELDEDGGEFKWFYGVIHSKADTSNRTWMINRNTWWVQFPDVRIETDEDRILPSDKD